MASESTELRVAMRPSTRQNLPANPDGILLDLVEIAKTYVRTIGEQSFRVIKQQIGFQKTMLRNLAKNDARSLSSLHCWAYFMPYGRY